MRLRISRARKAHYTPAWNKGIPRTEETKEKLRQADKSYTQTAEYRQKMSQAKKGCHHSEDTKERMRQAATGRKLTQEHRQHISLSRKGISKKTHPKMAVSPERREAYSLRMKQCWEDPKFRAKRLRCLKVGSCSFPTHPERRLRALLNNLFPREYKYVGDGKVWINGKNPDFINVNGQKKIVEMFGDYWHSKKHTGVPEKVNECRRQKVFRAYGYSTLIVWQRELKDLPALRRKLKAFHKGVL